ncbi:hypothetical protein M758_4G168700 [Ceratodon purpureus]|nr:hypothetical protein M758_4G168700 [Ceratodon purpureus]
MSIAHSEFVFWRYTRVLSFAINREGLCDLSGDLLEFVIYYLVWIGMHLALFICVVMRAYCIIRFFALFRVSMAKLSVLSVFVVSSNCTRLTDTNNLFMKLLFAMSWRWLFMSGLSREE